MPLLPRNCVSASSTEPPSTTSCLDADGTYICTAFNPRCYIIQKVSDATRPYGCVPRVDDGRRRTLLGCDAPTTGVWCGFSWFARKVDAFSPGFFQVFISLLFRIIHVGSIRDVLSFKIWWIRAAAMCNTWRNHNKNELVMVFFSVITNSHFFWTLNSLILSNLSSITY